MRNTAQATCLSDSVIQGLPASVEILSLAQARCAFQALEEWLLSGQARQLPMHEVEREQERRGREVQRLLLEAHMACRGYGDVGPAIQVQASASEGEPVLHTEKRMDTRHPQTIFGQIRMDRLGYCHGGKATMHPLDEQVQLPFRSFSYELQRRMVKAAVQGPFSEAVERVEESTGVSAPKRSIEQVVEQAACEFEVFYQKRTPPPQEKTGPILVGSVDCKGVPMKKPQPAPKVVRRGKGQKANKKKMAVVAAVYTQQPHIRTPQQVIENLFNTVPGPPQAQKEPPLPPIRPEYKRVWASLNKGKAGVIDQVVEDMARRDPLKNKDWVMLTDGERALQKQVQARLEDVPLVLDFQHVLEKLWLAAYAFHDEGSPEATTWVQQRALRILQGEVSQVIKGMGQSATKRNLSHQKKKPVKAAAVYFYRNRTHMRYDEYLQKGWPIATGVVEGACKNLVKDRMERSGMRWMQQGAEAMLKLRAVYLSDDFEEYWTFHIQQQQERLYPSGQWKPVNTVQEK